MTFLAGVLAHQGGWDEALMVAAPIGLFVVLLRVANARARAAEEQEPDLRSDPAPDDDPAPEDPGHEYPGHEYPDREDPH